MNEKGVFAGKKVLILEGGGFKTSFTGGVLDAFRSVSFDPFQSYIGVSGGSIAISYFLSNKYGYFYHVCVLCVKTSDSFNTVRHLAMD